MLCLAFARVSLAYFGGLIDSIVESQNLAEKWREEVALVTTEESMGHKRIHLVVRGRVQGVFYRASAQREARQNGLCGWVKNRVDGTVEMVVEGEENQVKDFLTWAQVGPSSARVDKVDTKWRSYTGEYGDFRIVGD